MPSKKCHIHLGRDAVGTKWGRGYCKKCLDGQNAAARGVDRHVTPRDCMVWFTGSDWKPIPGTGCAHWVAHQKRLTHGASTRCAQNCLVRVPDLVSGRVEVGKFGKLEGVRVGDIWANSARDHCGLVKTVRKDSGGKITVEIQHCSSRQGGVFTNDFHKHFRGKGSFFR